MRLCYGYIVAFYVILYIKPRHTIDANETYIVSVASDSIVFRSWLKQRHFAAFAMGAKANLNLNRVESSPL